jgi:hypothetical protein
MNKYKSAGSNDPDRLCHPIIEGESKQLDKVLANESLTHEFKEWLCHGILSYDSAKCHS